MIIVISQSLGLDLVSINVYAKVYQNIPLSSRDRAIFTFSEFEPRQRLGQNIPNSLRGKFHCFQNLNLDKTSTNPKCHFTILWATSCQYQCVCKILSKYSKRFKSYRHFSRTGRGQNFHKRSKDKIFTNCPMTKSNV